MFRSRQSQESTLINEAEPLYFVVVELPLAYGINPVSVNHICLNSSLHFQGRKGFRFYILGSIYDIYNSAEKNPKASKAQLLVE